MRSVTPAIFKPGSKGVYKSIDSRLRISGMTTGGGGFPIKDFGNDDWGRWIPDKRFRAWQKRTIEKRNPRETFPREKKKE